MTSERGFYGWKLVFFLWLLDFLNMGFPLYGGAVINTYMLKEIPMSRSSFGMGFTLLNLFVGIPSILVGASIVRLGIRKTFVIGSALILVGALWLSLIASRPWHYWMGFGVLTATGISVGICGLPRRPADQPNSDGEWRKLAASVGHGGRNFCFVSDCRVSVCERASGRPGPNGGRRAGRDALGEGDDGDCAGDKISVGTSTGLPHSSVLDDSRRCHRLPISVFFLYRPLAVAPERSGRAPSGRCIRHGSVHAGGRVRPLDWWLADGRNGGALRVHARFLLLFFGILPSDASFAGSAVDCLQRRHSLWNGVRMDVRLPEYRHGTLLRAGGISKGERNDAGACGSFLLA